MILNTLCVFGTRPEAIKMAPLIKSLGNSESIHNQICVTGQHEQLIEPVLNLFQILPDFNLKVMSTNQNLWDLTSRILQGLAEVFTKFKPHLVLVHGDTTTAFAAALAAYYHQIPVAHVEAGLRTGNMYSPWPEEGNRKLIGSLAHLHFAPTETARQNLLQEGFKPELIHVTGNTVIDALYSINHTLEAQPELSQHLHQTFPFLETNQKMILVTGHRRENFGTGFQHICEALLQIAKQFPEVRIVYPVHLNPHVEMPVRSLLKDMPNIHLIPPIDYLSFVYLMKKSYLILTDSGGIQEEAPALGKPVLVMRETTERPEALSAGTARLVGANVQEIVEGVSMLLTNEALYKKMSEARNPYGNGNAASKIRQIITESFISQENVSLKEIENTPEKSGV